MGKQVFEEKQHYKYGIMGGTFDPIHIGHLFLAEMVLDELGLDKVLFIPTGIPPHKNSSKTTPANHRLKMVSLATSKNPNFEVLSLEVNRQGISYTIDTLCELQRHYERMNEYIELHFIVGADGLLQFETWKNYQAILSLTKLVVVTRPGYDHNLLDIKIEELKYSYSCDIRKIVMPALEISSTDIRERLSQGKTIKYLVPEEVEDYIVKNNLYAPT